LPKQTIPFERLLWVCIFLSCSVRRTLKSMTAAFDFRGTAGNAFDVVRRWTNEPALRRLVTAFGANIPEDLDLVSRVKWLDEFSGRWDYRAGRERTQMVAAIPADISPVVERCADALGLRMARKPSHRRYDFAVVLGGVALSCATRTKTAADLLQCGLQISHYVYGLGTNRAIAPEEHRTVAEVLKRPLVAATEYAALIESAVAYFSGAKIVREDASGDPGSNTYSATTEVATSYGSNVRVLCSPTTDPSRRANTADTYLHFVSDAHAVERQSVLLITSPIYVPYQFFVAMQYLVLPFGLEIEMIGAEPIGTAAQSLTQPANYLQEIRSAIRSARSLIAKLA
jgi:hypothetical protein